MEKEWPEMTNEFKRLQREQYELFCRKQHDYGPGNISVGTMLQTDEDIYYGFSDNIADMLGTAANNLYLKGGDTIYELAIPHGVGDGNGKVYLHALRKTSSSASARLVYT